MRVLVVRSQCPRRLLHSKRKRKSVLLNVILFTPTFTSCDVFVTVILDTRLRRDDLMVFDTVNVEVYFCLPKPAHILYFRIKGKTVPNTCHNAGIMLVYA